MIDFDDGDQLLNLIGIILILSVIISIVIIILATISVQERSADVPDVNWESQQINESHIRITHAGGEPVNADKISITVDGTPRQPQWTAITLAKGEYGIVRVGEGNRVTLLWRHSERDRDVLKQWQLSEPTTQQSLIIRLSVFKLIPNATSECSFANGCSRLGRVTEERTRH